MIKDQMALPEQVGDEPRIHAAEHAADARRLSEVFAAEFPHVWRSLRRFGVPVSAVEDASQHVFVIFSQRMVEVAPGKERAFLVGTAYRVAANVRRWQARRLEVGGEVDVAPADGLDPEQLLEWKRRRQMLDEVLDKIPLDQRAVFVLYELEGLSSIEIAKTLRIPMGTVASRLRRARRKFGEQIQLLRLGETRPT
jgi:RNA polymerase sigma-70 factor (ECF subfamily)